MTHPLHRVARFTIVRFVQAFGLVCRRDGTGNRFHASAAGRVVRTAAGSGDVQRGQPRRRGRYIDLAKRRRLRSGDAPRLARCVRGTRGPSPDMDGQCGQRRAGQQANGADAPLSRDGARLIRSVAVLTPRAVEPAAGPAPVVAAAESGEPTPACPAAAGAWPAAAPRAAPRAAVRPGWGGR